MFLTLPHTSTAEKIVTSVKNIKTFKLPNSCKNSAGIWQNISAKNEDSYVSRSTMKAVGLPSLSAWTFFTQCTEQNAK
jgi:hypothetical protein